jgi:hypothetical protein
MPILREALADRGADAAYAARDESNSSGLFHRRLSPQPKKTPG